MVRTGASSGLAMSWMREECANRALMPGAVEVSDGGQVDDEWAALRGGQAERVTEPVGVAHVDLADSGHYGSAIGAARAWKAQAG